MEEANRMKRLPLSLFALLDEHKKEAKAKGIEIIDLGMGNPDMPTASHVVAELCKMAKDPKNHGYSRSIDPVEGQLRAAIAKWYMNKFKVKLDPESEVLPLIGSKEGIVHISLAFLNSDDIALVPNPAYPTHFNGVLIAGGILHNLPVKEEEGYLPDFGAIPKDVVKKSKMMFLSYPNNPTGAVATKSFFKKALSFAKRNDIMLIHDLAYSDIVFDGYRAPSLLEIPGAKDISVEFHTLSKSYNMAGWRIGFMVGNSEIVRILAKAKGYMDFGLFKPIQYAAIKALTGSQECVRKQVEIYRRRRDVLVDALAEIGWNVPRPKATFYLWCKIPDKYSALTSNEFVALLIREAGVVASPGTGFGEYGEGYIRFALVEKEERLREAVKRIKKVLEMQA